MKLQPFQTRFLSAATRKGVRTACLSTPRGNGKSRLASILAGRVLTPGDPLFVPGAESVLVAASLEQARIVFRFLRGDIEASGAYRFLDSHTRIAAVHEATNTRLRVVGSNGRAMMGLVDTPLVIADEPGAWLPTGGALVHDAIQTAMAKPGSPLKAVYAGTLAPSRSGWWHDLVKDGTRGSVYVQALQGRRERWSQWREIVRCNPLAKISADFRSRLREEVDEAKRDSRLKARFLSYRLNVPTADEDESLLTVDDYGRAEAREIGMVIGAPIVGVDLGGGRAWSAAVAVWPSGRCAALAVAPGEPDLETQEKRDRAPAGVYRELAGTGSLTVADGLRVPPVSLLWHAVTEKWGLPARIVCDRFRLGELNDVIAGACPVEPRVTRWSECAADIRALRKMASDGPLSFERDSRLLIAASLMFAMVKNDDAGNCRLVKRGTNNMARDDAAAALLLAAGAWEREHSRPAPDFTFFHIRPEELVAA